MKQIWSDFYITYSPRFKSSPLTDYSQNHLVSNDVMILSLGWTFHSSEKIAYEESSKLIARKS